MPKQTSRNTYRLEWYGDEIAAGLKTALSAGLANWAEVHEAAAKDQLGPGHGFWTGRAKASIHAAAPDYNFFNDFKPLPAINEMGNVGYTPLESGSLLRVAVGTGLIYAGLMEGRLQFMQRSHDQTIGQLEGELESAVKAAGYG